MDINSILSLLGDNDMDKIGAQAGVDKNQVSTALQGALPAVLAALKGNAQGKSGQQALANALDKDHDGSLLDNLGGFLDNPALANGTGILKHAFGSRRTSVENALSSKAGVSSSSMSKILTIAAPLVMSFLGREKRSNAMDAGGIASLVGNLFDSNANSSNDPADNGLDIGDIASMFISNNSGGIGGLLKGFLGR